VRTNGNLKYTHQIVTAINVGQNSKFKIQNYKLVLIPKQKSNIQHSSLQAQLAESKAEIARLKERLSTGTSIVCKDLTLISRFRRWSGAESALPLEEFLENIESCAGGILWIVYG